MTQDAGNIQSALDWLENIAAGCLNWYFHKAEHFDAKPFNYCDDNSWLGGFIRHYGLNAEELAVFVLALTPHLRPGLLSRLVSKHIPEGGDFPEFGGVKGANHRGILPTGETAQFILGGSDF